MGKGPVVGNGILDFVEDYRGKNDIEKMVDKVNKNDIRW